MFLKLTAVRTIIIKCFKLETYVFFYSFKKQNYDF